MREFWRLTRSPIPTYVGAIGGIRTRTAALVARRSSARRPIASAAPERFERSSSRLTSARIAAIMLQGITGGGAGSRTLISCLQDSHPAVERNPRPLSPFAKLGRASGFEPEPARSHRVVQRHYTMPATSSSSSIVVVVLEPPPRLARGCPHYECGASLSTLWRPIYPRRDSNPHAAVCKTVARPSCCSGPWVGQDLNLRGAFAQRGYGPAPSASRSPTHRRRSSSSFRDRRIRTDHLRHIRALLYPLS